MINFRNSAHKVVDQEGNLIAVCPNQHTAEKLGYMLTAPGPYTYGIALASNKDLDEIRERIELF